MQTYKNYDFILFDLDGTLTDPRLRITKSVQYALASFGIVESNLNNLLHFIGPPLKKSFAEYYDFNDAQADEAVRKYREYFSETGIYENAVYPGIPDLLSKLSNKGKVLAIATSKPTVFAAKILEHFKIIDSFAFVAGSNLDGSRVEKFEVIQYALSHLSVVDHEKIVMGGDRKHDIIGAKKVGIDSIGVLYGFGSPGEMNSESPTYIVKSVSELEKVLTKHQESAGSEPYPHTQDTR